MLRFLLFVLSLLLLVAPSRAQTLPGIDVLIARDFDILRGKRVGLVTNQTGKTRDGRATIDVLRAAPDVNLVALYAPEHGVRGEISAGQSVATYRDKATGLPVYSLYGATKRPTQAMLRGVQVLVFDIQDIGSRSYTFISTMGESMKSCAAYGIPYVVLDRPNPVGDKVEGKRASHFSFVAAYPIPYRYGLTMGELAKWLNARRGNTCQLTVVPMQNYRRAMTWRDTGLEWTASSPNIPRAESAFFYGATGILGELPGLSIGIGTPRPFELAGAPGLDASALERILKGRKLAGWDFRAVSWTPNKGRYAGKMCQGVQLMVTDPQRAETTRMNFEIWAATRKIAPKIAFFGSSKHNKMFDLGVRHKRDARADAARRLAEPTAPVLEWRRGGLAKRIAGRAAVLRARREATQAPRSRSMAWRCSESGAICMNSMRLPSGSRVHACKLPSLPVLISATKGAPRSTTSFTVCSMSSVSRHKCE